MKKLTLASLGAFIVSSAFLIFPAVVSAASPNWDVTGTWVATHEYDGNTYTHDNYITQAPDGTLTGTGGWDGTQNGIPISTPNTWEVTAGSVVDGNTIHINYTYTSVETCAVNGYVDAVINGDGSMAGTWHDDCGGGRDGTWTVPAGAAVPINVTTDPATSIGSSDATLNGTDGPADADNTSFWWGPSAPGGPITSGPNPGATAEFPAGWSHDPGLGFASASGTFNEPLMGLTPNTEYYFVAWVEISGVWYPGQVLNFTTPDGPSPSVITNSATSETPTTVTLNGTDGPVDADNISFWWGDTVPTGPITTPGPNPGATAEFPAGWSHDPGLAGVSAGGTFDEPLTSLNSGTTYYYLAWVKVSGIWYPGQVLTFITPTAAASCPEGTVQSADAVEIDSVDSSDSSPTSGGTLASGQPYLLVSSGTWNNSGGPNVADSMYSSFDNWTDYQEGQDATPYFLGPDEFNLEVDGSFVNWGPYDGMNHTYSDLYTGTGAPLSFLVFDGNSGDGPGSANTGWYGDNSGSFSVSVYSCDTPPTTGSISGTVYNDKNRDKTQGAGEPGLAGWTVNLETTGHVVIATTTTDASGDYTFASIAPGTYKVRESPKIGWTRTTLNPEDIVIEAGSVVTDVDFGDATLKKGEHQDTYQDCQHDDQGGDYYANHGKSDYGKDWNSKDHKQSDNSHSNNNNNGNHH